MSKLKELETDQCQELTCFYACIRQDSDHQPMMGVVDDTRHHVLNIENHRI